MKQAIIRLIISAVLIINAGLTAKGMNPIPFDENLFTEVATNVMAGLSVLWVWWKNNNMTKAAQDAHEYMKNIKEDGVYSPIEYIEEFDDLEEGTDEAEEV